MSKRLTRADAQRPRKPDPDLLFEIHYYHDPDPEKPDGFALFRDEQKQFDPTAWATWIGDSVTAAVVAARLEQQFVIQPEVKQPMKWHAGATDQLEMQLVRRVASYPCNVVLTAHIADAYVEQPTPQGVRRSDRRVPMAETSEGRPILLQGISAPGRLARDKGLVSQYAEVYRAYVVMGKKGPEWYLQTEPDGDWIVMSQLLAPDGARPDYKELWDNYKGPKTRPPVHAIIYGHPGTKKSTFAATFPTPTYVAAFDAYGKDMPYTRLGEVEEDESDLGVPIKRVYRA